MELQKFISTSLVEIMTAIHDAQVEWSAGVNKGAINPVWDNTDELYRHVQDVEFDIAVTVSNDVSGKAKAGIKVLVADMGGSAELKHENSSVSRIKFKVPVVPPVQIVEGGKKAPRPRASR